MAGKSKRIGEILIENNLITKQALDMALEHQKKYGGNITQYLIAYDFIKEEDLAKCISIQFGYPYLPLRTYDIPKEIIKLIPANIAEKYWLIPVDRIGNILTVVMADPLDDKAIEEVEKITSCAVQPFVGILSDIVKAIEHYYEIYIDNAELKKGKSKAPLFISTKEYAGFEHRKSIRIKADIMVHFPVQDTYKKSETKNVSMHGFLFESANALPIGSYIIMEIDLPEGFNPYPIAAVVQVVRVVPLSNKRFDIGVKMVNIPKEDADKIIRYAIATGQEWHQK